MSLTVDNKSIFPAEEGIKQKLILRLNVTYFENQLYFTPQPAQYKKIKLKSNLPTLPNDHKPNVVYGQPTL